MFYRIICTIPIGQIMNVQKKTIVDDGKHIKDHTLDKHTFGHS